VRAARGGALFAAAPCTCPRGATHVRLPRPVAFTNACHGTNMCNLLSALALGAFPLSPALAHVPRHFGHPQMRINCGRTDRPAVSIARGVPRNPAGAGGGRGSGRVRRMHRQVVQTQASGRACTATAPRRLLLLLPGKACGNAHSCTASRRSLRRRHSATVRALPALFDMSGACKRVTRMFER
jgi:hypothetical protein